MPTVELRTAIPGPKSIELMRRRMAAVARGPAHSTPVFAAQADGAMVDDVDGNRFIDFAGGIGCVNTGHRSPGVMSAIQTQIGKFLHTCFSVAPYQSYVEVAEKLNALVPGNFPKKTLLVNTGAEAIENAIKIARHYTKRPAIVCFEDAFHGRTMLTMSLTSKTNPYKEGFAPFASDIYRVPFAYCYRCSYSLAYPSCKVFCASHIEDSFKRVVAADSIAAIIVEPILGEGGFVTPPPEFLPMLQDICRRRGILLIADEVQTGIGRTGAMFACEKFGIEPDILVTAKSIGGGLPLGAVTGRAEIMDAPGRGALGGTFAGNPVACAAALAVLEELKDGRLMQRASELGERFAQRSLQWQNRWAIVGDTRGLGAMRAIELVRSRETREPAKEETEKVVKYCYEHGLLTISAGTYGNVLRILAPLVITDDQFDEGLGIIEAALASVCESRQPVASYTA
jgi:4-aminobutyrate aminotransferase / (S)-3-amino-2-methylpropionate transaminase / 5-aminovalerate transaminase